MMRENSTTRRIFGDEMTLTSPEVAPELQTGAVNQEPETVESLRKLSVPEKERCWDKRTSDNSRDLEKPADKVTATAEPEIPILDVVSIIFSVDMDNFAQLNFLARLRLMAQTIP